jgi:hypothetical protein
MKNWAVAAKDGRYDARNEDTVKQCAEVFEKVPNFGNVSFL